MADKGKVVQTVVTTETTTDYDDSYIFSDMHIIISDALSVATIGLILFLIFSKKPNNQNLKASLP